MFGSYFFDRFADPHYTPAANGGSASALVGLRGFTSPSHNDDPHLALNWSRTISPSMVNEMRAGWVRDADDIGSNNSGVPEIIMLTGEVNFGSYNGYPQIFHEEEFQFSDIATISHGKHTLKFGGSIQRNYENSEFNVGRPSYEFMDCVALPRACPSRKPPVFLPGRLIPPRAYHRVARIWQATSGLSGTGNLALFVNDTIK